MKKNILTAILFAAFAAACSTNSGTSTNNTANIDVSNTNLLTNNSAGAANSEKSTVANADKNTKNTSTKTGKPTERTGGERVKFAAGENDANLTRNIPANGSLDFLINAKKGQKIGIQLSYEGKGSDIEGFLSEPGLQDVALSLGAETRKEFVVKTTGDHRLTVVNKTGKKITTFTLYLDIY